MENDELKNDEVPEGGPYPAEYQGFEKTTITRQDGEVVSVLRHYWLVQVNDRQVKADCLSDPNARPGTFGGRIVKALIGRDLGPQESVKKESLIGKTARLIFETKKGRVRISNVLPG